MQIVFNRKFIDYGVSDMTVVEGGQVKHISFKDYLNEGIKVYGSPSWGTNAPSFNNHKQEKVTFLGFELLSTVSLFNGDRALVVDEIHKSIPDFAIRTSSSYFEPERDSFDSLTKNGRISRKQYGRKDVSTLETLATFSTGISVILDIAKRKNYQQIQFSPYGEESAGLVSLYQTMTSNHVFLRTLKNQGWSIEACGSSYIITRI